MEQDHSLLPGGSRFLHRPKLIHGHRRLMPLTMYNFILDFPIDPKPFRAEAEYFTMNIYIYIYTNCVMVQAKEFLSFLDLFGGICVEKFLYIGVYLIQF